MKRANTFLFPPDAPPPREEVLSALRALGFRARRPSVSLEEIGQRLEALLLPHGRGRLSPARVQSFLEAAAVRLAGLGKPWRRLQDAEILAELGVRKVIIAAGHSARFSPGLARKQLARGDGFSSLLLQARQAAGLAACPDVLVLDPAAAFPAVQALVDRDRLRKSWEREARALDVPAEIRRLVLGGLRSQPARFSKRVVVDLWDRARAAAAALHRSRPDQARTLSDHVANALFRPLVEGLGPAASCIPEAFHSLAGRDVILALARPWGPGEALLEGLRRLRDLGLSRQTRYVMPVYSDYAAALLPHHAPVYLEAYLEAVAHPDAVITLGVKSPLDRVEDRGNVLWSDGSDTSDKPDAPQPRAIREWRDMSEAEREDARTRLERSRRTGTPHHGVNAGVFVIDRAWAERQAAALRGRYDHPDPHKGKPHEYWYTDLVELAARQKRPRRVVFLGEDAPAGCKDVPRLLQFGEQMIAAVREILVRLGVHLDATARVRLRGTGASFSLEQAARAVFGGMPDSVHLFGDVFLEDTVRISSGAVLDGRGQPVDLRGHTTVGQGVGLRQCAAVNTRFDDNPLDAFSYCPPEGRALQTPTEVVASSLAGSTVGPGARIQASEILSSFVEGQVLDSRIAFTLVARDERLVQARRETCSVLLASSSAPYIPGAFRIGELAPEDQRGVLAFIRQETEKLLESKIPEGPERRLAMAVTGRLWNTPDFLASQTPESLYRHAFGWIRSAGGCSARGGTSRDADPYRSEKRAEIESLRRLADRHFQRLQAHDFSNPALTRSLFRELTLLAVQANFFDWQSPTVRTLLHDPPRSRVARHSAIPPAFTDLLPGTYAIDHSVPYESLVFDAPEGSEFLYLTDNTGEALFDALVWDFLCRIGLRVAVAAKEKPAGGDATTEDILRIVRGKPSLRAHFGRGALRVLSSGSDTYGTLLDRAPEAFRTAALSPGLRALIGKGQANLYTSVARNPLPAPYVAQFLVKGMTAERLTGVRALRKAGRRIPRPVLAVIPAGESVTGVAPGRAGSRTLKAVAAISQKLFVKRYNTTP